MSAKTAGVFPAKNDAEASMFSVKAGTSDGGKGKRLKTLSHREHRGLREKPRQHLELRRFTPI